jgi:hypothetical protein
MPKETCVLYLSITERCDGFDCAYGEEDTCCYHCQHRHNCGGPCTEYKEDNST